MTRKLGTRRPASAEESGVNQFNCERKEKEDVYGEEVSARG